MKIQNLFTSGKMNKDLDERLLPQGEYRDALNIKVANSNGSDVGAIENALSNEAKSSLELGANAVCLGALSDDEDRVIYWFVKSDTGCYVCYYDQKDDSTGFVMSDTRLLTNQNPQKSVLNFSESHLIQANILTDADNLKKFIYFTDGLNPPRRINVATAKGYEVNGFTDEDINVIVKPPLSPPKISLSNDLNQQDNTIKDKFIQFAYRYIYQDGERSSLSQFSNVCFQPKSFNMDFEGALNKSMENYFNRINVEIDSGSSLVKKIDLVFKETGNNNIYLAKTIDKKDKKYLNNTKYSVDFDNNSVYTVLPEDEILRLYDNVPTRASSQEIISNRLVYGNYSEGYNLKDTDGEDVQVNLTASYEKSPVSIESGQVKSTARSSRDYEIGITYLDKYGRSTTVLTSENNSVHVNTEDSTKSNTLKATISNVAPYWAEYYRFYVKQSHESDYDTICPLVFYSDNDYYWIRLEGDDKNKIKEGEQVIVKSDVLGVKKNSQYVKVLEAGLKNKNFLEASDYSGATAQESGYYIKVKQYGLFINDINFLSHKAIDYDSTADEAFSKKDYENNFSGDTTSYTEGPFFIGVDGTQDDLNLSGTFNGNVDKRFEVRISSVGGTDTFAWRAYDISTSPGAFSSDINCSTSNISLSDGLSVNFTSTTGHSVGDIWTFNSKASMQPQGYDDPLYAYAVYNGIATDNEKISAGSRVNIYYKEKKGVNGGGGTFEFDESFIASANYYNIEEMFWSEIAPVMDENDLNYRGRVFFRRGQYSDFSPTNNTFAVTGSSSDPLCMIIKSDDSQANVKVLWGIASSDVGRNVHVNASWNILLKDTDVFLILETQPTKEVSDVFYEVPGTYPINDCGYHVGLKNIDIDQTFASSAVISLNFSNAWSFGNGFESYKIRDAFVAPIYSIKNRPLTFIENYRENKRNVSVTYSDVYEQSTNYNGLNEFNLAKVNYVDLDDEYGDIQRIHSRDTNLVVFQENKVSQLLYNKSVIFNADGTGNVSQNLNVFGQQLPYNGEYGISNSPHSFSSWGSRMYFADERRGSIMRLSQDGLTEVSQYGMRDWFRDNVNAKNDNVIIGGYDPFNGQYIVSIKDPVVEWREDEFICGEASCDLKAKIYVTPETTTTTSTTTTTTTSTTTTTTTTAAPGTTTTTTAAPATTTTTTTAPPVNCYIYDIAADGGDTVVFTWITCNGGNGFAEVLNGDAIQTSCAQEGTVSMSPNTGTITLSSSC